MCINVACRADVAVPQPLLNLLQAHAIGIEQTGAAMAQIVKADTLHLVCDQKIREMLAQEIGPNPFSHRVYIDIVKIIGAIAFAADLPILLLLLFHFIEHQEFHPLAKWDDFIADPGRYLNGMIEGEFEE